MEALQLSPQVNRRSLVQAGALGMVGLTLSDLLSGRAAAAEASRADSCIFIVQYGGASHHDTFDLKPEAPAEIRGPYRPIPTPVDGIRVCELLPRLARLAPHYTVVRSMTHENGEHNGGMHVCMTGRSRPDRETPYFGSVVARLRPTGRAIPPYVWIQDLDGDVEPRYLHGGFLGAQYAPMFVAKKLDNPSNPGFQVTAFDPPSGVPADRLARRRQLVGRVEGDAASAADAVSAGMRERAFDLINSGAAARAFDLQHEPSWVRDRYGRHPLGQNLLMARRLVEGGVRLVTVNAWPGFPAGEKFIFTQGWDMHGTANQESIFGASQYGLGFALPRLDQAVSALLEDLEQRGHLERTLVVMVGEFGRTPKIVNNPFPGRDHWPHCYSALLAGGGVRRGAVYGASDKIGAYVDSDPVTPEQFGATLYHALGINPATRLGLDGFTQPASTGEPILELFS